LLARKTGLCNEIFQRQLPAQVPGFIQKAMITITEQKENLFSTALVGHVKQIAETTDIDAFSAWYVQKMIIPYCTSQEGKAFQDEFYRAIGFKKEPTIDKVYHQLKIISITKNQHNERNSNS
jgi:hypothetical protein